MTESSRSWLDDRLDRFLRHLLRRDVRLTGRDFVWPAEWSSLKGMIEGSEWCWTREAALSSIFGIRRLVCRVPFPLARLRWSVLWLEGSENDGPPSLREAMEHYLVLELFAPDMARILLCMHVPPSDWLILDEHTLHASDPSLAGIVRPEGK